jgi:hypothetical protein
LSEQNTIKHSAGPGYLEVIVIALVIITTALFGYHRLFAQKIMVLDLKGYLRTQKALLSAGEISEEQWKAGLDRVEAVLNNEAANHVVVLKEVVLRNGEEIKLQ